MKLDQFKRFKETSGNSLMEFSVTVGLMAILAATAAPKLSNMGELTKKAFKTLLGKRDTLREKKRSILHIYELN